MRLAFKLFAGRMPSSWAWRLWGASALLLLLVGSRAAAGPPVDFGAYYGAAVALRDGRSPYVDALVWRQAGYVTGSPGRQPTAETAYVYPPALALALVPLTVLPMHVAGLIWVVILLGSVVGTAWCLALVLTDRRDSRISAADIWGLSFWGLVAALVVLFLLFKPVRGALTFSKQVDPLILLLLAGTVVSFARRHDWLVAILLGLAVAIKPFLLVLALGLLWKGAWRAALGSGLVAAAVGLGPLLALGLLPDFLAAASHWAGPAMLASPVGQSAASLLVRTLTVQPYTVPLLDAPWLVAPLQVMMGAGLLGGLLASVSRSREQPPLVLLLEWGLGVTALLVFGPLTEEHHLAYLLLGLTATLAAANAVSVRAVRNRGRSAAARRLAQATAVLVGLLLLPGTQAIAWGFYAYLDGPIRPPVSLLTFFFPRTVNLT